MKKRKKLIGEKFPMTRPLAQMRAELRKAEKQKEPQEVMERIRENP